MSSVAFKNVEEMLEYFNEHKDAVSNLLSKKSTAPSPSNPANATDALGQRDVVKQAQEDATNAKTSKPGPSTLPRPMPKFTSKSAEARNSMRLVNGPDSLFTPITRFGANTYVPDLRLNHRLVHHANRIIMANKRFYDSSEFFHPIVAHIYIAVIEIVLILRSMRAVARLSTEQSDFLDWFESQYSLEALPVPGFLRNQFNTLAASSPALHSYDNVSPILPATTGASANTLYTMCDLQGNIGAAVGDALEYSYRIPNIGALMSQLHGIINSIVAAGAGANAATVTGWVDFGTLIFGFASYGGTTVAPTHPATPRAATPLRAGAYEATHALFGSPGFETFNNPTRNVATTFFDYYLDLQAMLPALPANYASTLEITYREYMCMNANHRWFTEFARVMSFYSQFFKDSTNLGAITPIGNAGNQIWYETQNVQAALPAGRFPAVEIQGRGQMLTLSVPDADAVDSAIAMINLDSFYPTHDEPQNGPFFEQLPVVKRTRTLEPENGYGQVLTDYYRNANAEQPVPE